MSIPITKLKAPVYPVNGDWRARSKSWGISGDGFMVEREFFGIWFGHERRIQKWAPLMSEVEQIYTIRIGHVKLSITKTYKVFRDGKEPMIIPSLN